MKGKFLNDLELKSLQKEIELRKVSSFNLFSDNIDTNLFNFDNPLCQKMINGNDIRITEGLIKNKTKTFLVYKNSQIIGEFYNITNFKEFLTYIENSNEIKTM